MLVREEEYACESGPVRGEVVKDLRQVDTPFKCFTVGLYTVTRESVSLRASIVKIGGVKPEGSHVHQA